MAAESGDFHLNPSGHLDEPKWKINTEMSRETEIVR